MKNVYWIGAAVLLLLLDSFSKKWAVVNFTEPVQIWPGVFELAASKNTAASFSIPIQNSIMIFLTPILIVILAWIIKKHCDTSKIIIKIAAVLALAGALGNWAERLFKGGVTDFLAFSFWPSFNLADMYLTAAAFILIFFCGKMAKTNF